MAKKRKVSKGTDKGFFSFDWNAGKSKKEGGLDYVAILEVFAVAVVVAGIGIGFYFLEGYVKETPSVRHNIARLKFESPQWVSQELLAKLRMAACDNKKEVSAGEETAITIAHNLQNIAWLYNVRVRIEGDTINIGCQWRRPVAVYQTANGREIYVASDMMVLEHVPVIKLPIVELRTVQEGEGPVVGQIWQRDDVAAAVALLNQLQTADEMLTKEKPLLFHIAGIDVGNYANRKAKNLPQIVLFAKDGTNINWGAPLGNSSKYFEASDQEKIAMLYDFYKQNGKLSEIVKYVELRNPQRHIPTPTLN